MLLTENMHDVFVLEGDDIATVKQNILAFNEKVKSYECTDNANVKVYFTASNDTEAVAVVCC